MGLLNVLSNLFSRRRRNNVADPDAENNNETSSRDAVSEDSIGGDGEIIAEADITTERETGEGDTEAGPGTGPSGDKQQKDLPQDALSGETASEMDESERRKEEREALQSLDEALGKDAISEGGSSIMEPAPSTPALPHQEKTEGASADSKAAGGAETPEQVSSEATAAENLKPSTLEVIDENEKVENKTTGEPLKENAPPSTLLKQNSDENSPEGGVDPTPVTDNVEQKVNENISEAAGEPILAEEFRGVRLKSDDNSSLGEISVDPRLDTGTSLDDLVPPESPMGMDALEGAGSDEDSDYPEERQLPSMGQKAGYGQYSTFLTGKKYQATPRAGDVLFRKSVHNSGKEASSLEMVISSKMAADTQEELVSALDKVRTLQSKVTDVEKDVSEAQTYAFDARKEAMEAKEEAIKAKQQAAEAMEEALEAKKDAVQKRQDIQSISLGTATASAASISQLTDNVLVQNSASPGSGSEDSLGFVPSVTPNITGLSSAAASSGPDIAQIVPTSMDRVSSLSSEASASVSSAAAERLKAVENESRSIAREGSALADRVGDGLQDVRNAAT
ncbi:hypothetical protein EGW08_009797, partial [Elysia chlorotica]